MTRWGFALLLVVAGAPAWGAVPHNQPGLSLAGAFEVYVQAVQGADLEALFTTVTDREPFFFLTATGRLIDTLEGYREFHREWFAETGWEMPVEKVAVHESGDHGSVVAIFHYQGKASDGRTGHLDSYFTLLFERQEGLWKVVGDVCTPIARATSEAGSALRYTSEQAFFLCFTPIGVPVEWPLPPVKRGLDELMVWESF